MRRWCSVSRLRLCISSQLGREIIWQHNMMTAILLWDRLIWRCDVGHSFAYARVWLPAWSRSKIPVPVNALARHDTIDCVISALLLINNKRQRFCRTKLVKIPFAIEHAALPLPCRLDMNRQNKNWARRIYTEKMWPTWRRKRIAIVRLCLAYG